MAFGKEVVWSLEITHAKGAEILVLEAAVQQPVSGGNPSLEQEPEEELALGRRPSRPDKSKGRGGGLAELEEVGRLGGVDPRWRSPTENVLHARRDGHATDKLPELDKF